MQENNSLTTPVRFIKGVGPKRSEDLARLGIRTAEDLLSYLPARYEDRSDIVRIKDVKVGQAQAIEGRIISASVRRSKSGKSVFQAVISDQSGFIHAVWFNQPYLKDYLTKSVQVILFGKVERYDIVQIVNPEYEIVKADDGPSVSMRRIVPVYPASSELSSKYIRSLTFQALSRYSGSLEERLPAGMISRLNLADNKFAFRNIHFPSTFEDLEKAYRRIVFEEFLILQLALAMKRSAVKSAVAKAYIHDGALLEQFRRAVPFELTAGQKKAVSEIARDMSSGKIMNRLLQGDVGSGKTIVAAYALVMAVQNGFQGCLLAPTEVLARQHFIGLSELLMPLGISVSLVVGGLDQDVKRKALSDIKDGSTNVVVGTHAVIQDTFEFSRLGIAVVDEQHKFGVGQRAVMQLKGQRPHMLYMTATPIPRSLALTVYGDLDMTVIKELPKGRKPIATYLTDEGSRDKIYDFVKEELGRGRQAYVICPKIRPPDDLQALRGDAMGSGVRNAAETFNRLREAVFPGYEVGLMHGRMPSKDKEKVMMDFKKGKIKVLVSTVVIEVGIDVPNATVMIIENAERFGLSQLHQLRGRVGRGDHESYCILLADPRSEGAADRLRAIEKTVDGFEIAEADLELRGPGEFFGTHQHGFPELRFGNILKDYDIMELARKEALDIMARDPAVKEDVHRHLKEAVNSRFKGRIDVMSTA